MTRARLYNPLQGPAIKRAVAAMLTAGLKVKQVEFRRDGTFVVVPSVSRERDDVIAGSPAIARALGVSALTVRRMVKDGRLRAFKTGNASSPLKVRLSEIDRVNRAAKPRGSVTARSNAKSTV